VTNTPVHHLHTTRCQKRFPPPAAIPRHSRGSRIAPTFSRGHAGWVQHLVWAAATDLARCRSHPRPRARTVRVWGNVAERITGGEGLVATASRHVRSCSRRFDQ
jgi:hypothetical protein